MAPVLPENNPDQDLGAGDHVAMPALARHALLSAGSHFLSLFLKLGLRC